MFIIWPFKKRFANAWFILAIVPSESAKQDENMFQIVLVLGYFISDLHVRYKVEVTQYPYKIFGGVKSWLFAVAFTKRTRTAGYCCC